MIIKNFMKVHCHNLSIYYLGLRGRKHYLTSCSGPISCHWPIKFWRPGRTGCCYGWFWCLTYYQSFDIWWGQKPQNLRGEPWIHHFRSCPSSRFKVSIDSISGWAQIYLQLYLWGLLCYGFLLSRQFWQAWAFLIPKSVTLWKHIS